MRYFLFIIIILTTIQFSRAQNSSVSTDHTIFLIGDIKYPTSQSAPLQLLVEQTQQSNTPNTIIILGDIIYPEGLPDEDEKEYKQAKSYLDNQLDLLKNANADIYYLPGNHDWAKGKEEGLDHIKNLQKYIKKSLDNCTFIPKDGCPGPIEIALTEDITLITIDSQWYLHQWEKNMDEEDCGIETEADVMTLLKDALLRNQGKQVILATHHPLHSEGIHGGHFPAKSLLFPLTEKNEDLYIPLPGFIYTSYRKFFGNIQDLSHPDYKAYSEGLQALLEEFPNIIFASGHEHSLQYKKLGSIQHIISGGGGEATYIRKKHDSEFAAQKTGFATIQFNSNQQPTLNFWSPESNSVNSPIYTTNLELQKATEITESTHSSIDFKTPITTQASLQYEASPLINKMIGENYRKEWATIDTFEVFDISKEKGGLKIIQRGGGQQTLSVRMEDKNGKQYVLRSIDKNVAKALDPVLRKTFAVDIVQDAISAAHPYSSLTVPIMADAAGVYHTNPRVVYVPDDHNLGIYRKDLANGLYLFEERPAGNRKDISSFGNSEKIISTPKVLEKTQEDEDHLIDQQAVLRARLFDTFLNDWDRHDDQWRWASFKDDDKTWYRPIPRDRDQVYFLNEGWLTWLMARKWIMPKFQGFDGDTKNMSGLIFNARYFDRTFLTEPSLDQWIETATKMQANLTDEVITKAVHQLPGNTFTQSGEEIIDKLKGRRDNLVDFARRHYYFINKEVNIVGTDQRDLFKVEHLKDGKTNVTVYHLTHKGERKRAYYNRTFNIEETKEIRLYGLKGKDLFEIDGTSNKAVKIRIIGGKSDDLVTDNSDISSPRKNTLVYDKPKGIKIKGKRVETRNLTSRKKSVNTYDRKAYKYDKVSPLITFGSNIDDGLFFGAGFTSSQFNFRDSTIHKILIKHARKTEATSMSYDFLTTNIFNGIDLTMEATVQIPNFSTNFFGLGNKTTYDKDKGELFYRTKYQNLEFHANLMKTYNNEVQLKVGPFLRFCEAKAKYDRYLTDVFAPNLEDVIYQDNLYFGLEAIFKYDTRNNELNPQSGVLWNNRIAYYEGFKDRTSDFLKLQSDLALYLSFKRDPRTVFALRFGGASNIGDYEFYNANILGGKSNLRGFREARFYGDDYLYQNTDIRFKIKKITNYYFSGDIGLIVFNDLGRVWLDGEKSKKWHHGYGGGFWISPLEAMVITTTYNISKEEKRMWFNFSYLF
ncbi:hypothetical protein EYV94_12540 [Puteibacter caeruleilacunae]|nr:hypothetical protein EYV94_12540 [Puteibacter caeruleilacunae]